MSANTSLTALETVAAALAFGNNIGVKFTVFSLRNPGSANTISLDRATAIAAIEGAVMHLKANPGHDGPRVRRSHLQSTHQRGQFQGPADELVITKDQADVERTADRHPAELTVQAVDQGLYTRPIVEQRPFNRTNGDRFSRDHSRKYFRGKWATAATAKYLAMTTTKVPAFVPMKAAAALPRSTQLGLPAGSTLVVLPMSATREVPRLKSAQGGTAPATEAPSVSVVSTPRPSSVPSPATSPKALPSSGTSPFTADCLLVLPRAIDAIGEIAARPSPNTIEVTPFTSSRSSDYAAAETRVAETDSTTVATSSSPSSCPSPSASATPLLSSAASAFTSSSSLGLPLAHNPVRELTESDHKDFAFLYESVQCLLETVAPAAAGASLAESPSKGDGLRSKTSKAAKRVRSLGTALKRKLSKAF